MATDDERRPRGHEAPSETTGESSRDQPTATSPLRRALDDAMAHRGCSMNELTVLARQNDPFRLDTPRNHRDGSWLAVTARELGLGDRQIHLRGLHYMVIGRPKPDGTPYTNTDADWEWISTVAGKAARWLSYIPFDQIVDQRNGAPEVQPFTRPEPKPVVYAGISIDVPDADEIDPWVDVEGFTGVQPYRLGLIGEKSSLNDVLGPIAHGYGADLYLPTGEMSDTLIYTIARTGAEDGRPLRIFYFADADPAGWQMPISVARKLQAFRAALFTDLDFEIHQVALVPMQVRAYGLPSTPLKEPERRADSWRAAMGVEQTEIDALASLQPELLRRIAQEALDPLFDHTLDDQVRQARNRWRHDAQAAYDAQLDGDRLAALRAEGAEKLDTLRDEIEAINEALAVAVPEEVDLPPIVVPEPATDRVYPLPLLDSGWSFAGQCRALNDSKAYGDGQPRGGAA